MNSNIQMPQSEDLAKLPEEVADPEQIKTTADDKVSDTGQKHEMRASRLKELQFEAKVRVILEQRSTANKRI